MDIAALNGCLPSWRDGSAKQSLTTFLHGITHGGEALPIEARVAAFDNDGTLACEKPRTALAAFLLDKSGGDSINAGEAIEAAGGHQVLRDLGRLFAGWSTAEYDGQARQFLARARHPRFGRPYPGLVYQPMRELVTLLHALDFRVFMCTDSSRDFDRVMAATAYGLHREQVIGSEVKIELRDGQLVRTATLVPLDDGPGKTVHLWDRTGTQPVLAAGNAAGDIEMLHAARHALLIDHDDPIREYAYHDQRVLNEAAAFGWTVASIRNDFSELWPAEHDGLDETSGDLHGST